MTPQEENKRRKTLTLAHTDYNKALNSHAFFKLNDHAIGEDLVQETFMKTWRYLVKGGEIEIMKAFLYHVLNNLIVDQYRKRKTVSLDILMEKGFEPSTEDFSAFLNILDGKSVVLLITQLPPPYKKIMRMRYVDDLSLTEISLATGKTKNTIAVQVHRGIEKLKVLYQKKP